MTLLQAKLMRTSRERDAAEGARLAQEDELNALRQQVLLLRAQLSSSEEARTEAYAKLNGVFHGEEAQWMVRELLLHDELQDLEEELSEQHATRRHLAAERAKTSELQSEITELLAIETELQRKLDEATTGLKHTQQDLSSSRKELEKVRHNEAKLIDTAGKAKLRMQMAEEALAEAEGSYAKGAMRWRTQIDVLRGAMHDCEADVNRAIFQLAKAGLSLQPKPAVAPAAPKPAGAGLRLSDPFIEPPSAADESRRGSRSGAPPGGRPPAVGKRRCSMSALSTAAVAAAAQGADHGGEAGSTVGLSLIHI